MNRRNQAGEVLTVTGIGVAKKIYLPNVKPFAHSYFDYSHQYEMNYLSVSSLSWPSFLKVNAGEPDSSKRFEDGAQGRG